MNMKTEITFYMLCGSYFSTGVY